MKCKYFFAIVALVAIIVGCIYLLQNERTTKGHNSCAPPLQSGDEGEGHSPWVWIRHTDYWLLDKEWRITSGPSE